LDIEGAERDVLLAAGPWIESVDAVVAELHEKMKPGCETAFETVAQGFERRWKHGENHFLARAASPFRPGQS
jgi:hypothetical protein